MRHREGGDGGRQETSSCRRRRLHLSRGESTSAIPSGTVSPSAGPAAQVVELQCLAGAPALAGLNYVRAPSQFPGAGRSSSAHCALARLCVSATYARPFVPNSESIRRVVQIPAPTVPASKRRRLECRPVTFSRVKSKGRAARNATRAGFDNAL